MFSYFWYLSFIIQDYDRKVAATAWLEIISQHHPDLSCIVQHDLSWLAKCKMQMFKIAAEYSKSQTPQFTKSSQIAIASFQN